MITFGAKKQKLSNDRKTPDQYDLMFFDPTHVQFCQYHGHKINQPYDIGWEYHILLYKRWYRIKNEKRFVEGFDACLIDPLEYAESIVGNGYYGYIGKCSDRSPLIFSRLYDEVLAKGNADDYFKYIS